VRSLLPFLHLCAVLACAAILLFLQSYVFAELQISWLHLDLLAVFVFYVGLEHHPASAIFKIVFISLLAELYSAVPAGFLVTSHMLMMLLGNRLAIWLEMQRRQAQVVLFAFLLVIKEGLFAAMLSAMGLHYDAATYIPNRVPGMVATILIALPLMEFLAFLDGWFESRVFDANASSRYSSQALF
jgi:hypothetical protein